MNNKGVSLVEIVVALVLLMLVISGFSAFFTQSMLWAARSNKDTTSVAQARMYTDSNMIQDISISSDLADIVSSNVDTDSDTRTSYPRLLDGEDYDSDGVIDGDVEIIYASGETYEKRVTASTEPSLKRTWTNVKVKSQFTEIDVTKERDIEYNIFTKP
jgi:lipopolysaccharide export LptBFGC system permease protein LptF